MSLYLCLLRNASARRHPSPSLGTQHMSYLLVHSLAKFKFKKYEFWAHWCALLYICFRIFFSSLIYHISVWVLLFAVQYLMFERSYNVIIRRHPLSCAGVSGLVTSQCLRQ